MAEVAAGPAKEDAHATADDESASKDACPTRLVGGLRAWWHVASLSFRRQWWSLQTFLALVLVAMLAVLVGIISVWRGWSYDNFAQWILSTAFISFILPLLCLSIGTQSVGGEWEERSLIWLLTRPIPRPLIYLGKLLAAVPWALLLTLGSFGLISLLAGEPGLLAFRRFWPAVALGTLAYLSLFVLMGAWFRRSTIIAVVYSFFFETLIGNLPGMVKRASVGFYSRCMVYAPEYGIVPERPELFMAVDAALARDVLVYVTFAFVLLGLLAFSRREYHDLT